MNDVFAAPIPVRVPVAQSNQYFPVHRIYCVGRNYAEHAIEMGHNDLEPPFFFMKPADAIVSVMQNSVGSMRYPTLTSNLHPEVELVIAIGKGASHIAEKDALHYVWGYSVGLDMTRRDRQNELKKQGRPWCMAKGFEQSAPLAAIVPLAEAHWTEHSVISLAIDGQVRQSAVLGQMLWSVPQIISQLSQIWTLAAGDLIFTGTPAGVSAVEVGQTMHAYIEGVGTLEVRVAPRLPGSS